MAAKQIRSQNRSALIRGLVVGAVAAAAFVGGCTVSTVRQTSSQPAKTQAQPTAQSTTVHHAHGSDAPEISRSVGTPGGVVVLWPRIIPKSDDPTTLRLADALQNRLAAVGGKALQGGGSVDKRPQPERVCPRPDGCITVSLGAVLAVRGEACAVVGLVGPPGAADVQLTELAGTVKLKSSTTPFRDPPENAVTITEFAKCADILRDLENNVALAGEAALIEAARAANR